MVLCAASLTTEPVLIRNVPALSDIDTMLRLFDGLQVRVQREVEGPPRL
jgi:UDP-N-acetylglucosamine enolpyruvyl transferase